MTHRTPPQPSVGPVAPAEPVLVGLRNPGEVVAAIPGLLGYRPARSVVLVLLGGSRRRIELTMRVDLPAGGGAERWTAVAAALSPGVAASGAAEGVLVLVDADRAAGLEAVEHIGPVLLDLGVSLADALVTLDGRYGSVLCADLTCCPSEGRPIPRGSAVAAAAVVAGRVIHDTREDLGAEISPPDSRRCTAADEVATQMAAAVQHGTLDLSIDGVDELLDRACATAVDGELPLDQAVGLAVMVGVGEVRDQAYVHVVDAAERHRAVWAAVCRQVPERLSTVPLVLFALSAYLMGDGAVANVALDRALRVDQWHPSVQLLGDLLAAGVPPLAIRAALTRPLDDED